ncbi:diphthine--ammonia ligase [Candidatus Woesearchaeota archaeon]|nr:diphthine--ammonia ligase [Candidatus Woesearchaeota archaeon]
MCGIIGSFNRKDSFEIIKTGLNIIKDRGRDGVGYYDKNRLVHKKSIKNLSYSESFCILGHNLHSIVNSVPQPIKLNNSVIAANCEIYNWKELKKEFKIQAENDAELLIKLIEKTGIIKTLEKLRGVYAFCCWKKNSVYLARDIIGVKPLWYSLKKDSLVFCSEKKAIKDYCTKIEELNPRQILKYDLKTGKTEFISRDFLSFGKEVEEEKTVLEKLKRLLVDAVRIRIPEKKFSLLFSGGIDSVIIAKILKDLGCRFTCYTAGTSKTSYDIVSAKRAADLLDLDLKYMIVPEEKIKKYLEKIVPLIEDNNVVKVGVALPLFIGCTLAKKDNNKVIFSGSGADELFGGYYRYKNFKNKKNLNKDSYSDILKIYEKNTYRDDCITMNNNLELRVPFLDKELVEYALNISPELKIKKIKDKMVGKYILRKLAVDLNIPEELSFKKKKAAQYGSGFDKAIKKSAKKKGLKKKSEFLATFYKKPNLRLGALISSGKDGLFAAYTMKKQNYKLSCVITITSENPDSYMFHTPNVSLARMQAEAMGIPIVLKKTRGKKEEELDDLKEALAEAKEKHNIQGVVSGALFSNYQRTRIEKICDSLGLKIFSPLWHIDQEKYMRHLLKSGFEIIFSSVAAFGLDSSWLNRKITQKDILRLAKLKEKYGLNVAGEGGEYESLVIDCPMFEQKIKILDSEIKKEDKNTAKLLIKKAVLEEKNK